MTNLNKVQGVTSLPTPKGKPCSEQPESLGYSYLSSEGAGLKCVLGIYKGEPLQRSRIRASMETGCILVDYA